jgi:transposase
MIQITPQHHLFVHIQPIDFRKGMDSIIGLCRSTLKQDPFSGMIFVFKNRRNTAVKLLVYDGTGFWLCAKRFSQGKLQCWPQSPHDKVCATTLMVILNQGVPVQLAPSWRQLPGSA